MKTQRWGGFCRESDEREMMRVEPCRSKGDRGWEWQRDCETIGLNYVLSVWCHYLPYGYCIICAFMYCSCMQIWPTCGIGMLSFSMMFWSHSICTLCIFRSYIRIILVDGCFFCPTTKSRRNNDGDKSFFLQFLWFCFFFKYLYETWFWWWCSDVISVHVFSSLISLKKIHYHNTCSKIHWTEIDTGDINLWKCFFFFRLVAWLHIPLRPLQRRCNTIHVHVCSLLCFDCCL